MALEIQAPAGPITIETLHNGDPVGWSWLFEPYLTHFDARSRGTTRAIKFDAGELRRRCEADAQLGYELMRSFTASRATIGPAGHHDAAQRRRPPSKRAPLPKLSHVPPKA